MTDDELEAAEAYERDKWIEQRVREIVAAPALLRDMQDYNEWAHQDVFCRLVSDLCVAPNKYVGKLQAEMVAAHNLIGYVRAKAWKYAADEFDRLNIIDQVRQNLRVEADEAKGELPDA